jgi:elongation factor G
VTGTEPVTDDGATQNRSGNRSVIHAEVPALELLRYAAALRSLTGGAATFTRTYLRHDPAPAAVSTALQS